MFVELFAILTSALDLWTQLSLWFDTFTLGIAGWLNFFGFTL